jgi:hypothetical protein
MKVNPHGQRDYVQEAADSAGVQLYKGWQETPLVFTILAAIIVAQALDRQREPVGGPI